MHIKFLNVKTKEDPKGTYRNAFQISELEFYNKSNEKLEILYASRERDQFTLLLDSSIDTTDSSTFLSGGYFDCPQIQTSYPLLEEKKCKKKKATGKEGITKIHDGNSNTKFFSPTLGTAVFIIKGYPTKYKWYTANDNSKFGRTLCHWKIYVNRNLKDFIEEDHTNDVQYVNAIDNSPYPNVDDYFYLPKYNQGEFQIPQWKNELPKIATDFVYIDTSKPDNGIGTVD